jgi:hypothetical protein
MPEGRVHLITEAERKRAGRPRSEPRNGLAEVGARVERLTYTLGEAASATGLSVNTLRRRAAEGRLRLIKCSGRTLVCAASLRRLVGLDQDAAA